MALGAGREQIGRMVVGTGLRLAAVGVVIGTVGALLVSRLLRGLLYGVAATDPVTYAAAAALLIAAALLASYIPARRATMVDPVVALRYE
jgi:putative ABC transport system permease protein